MSSNSQHDKDSQTGQQTKHGPVSSTSSHSSLAGGNGKGEQKASASKGSAKSAGASRSTVKAARGKP